MKKVNPEQQEKQLVNKYQIRKLENSCASEMHDEDTLSAVQFCQKWRFNFCVSAD